MKKKDEQLEYEGPFDRGNGWRLAVLVLVVGLLVWFFFVTLFAGQHIEVPGAPGDRTVYSTIRTSSVDTVWLAGENTVSQYVFQIQVSDSCSITNVVLRRASENDVLTATLSGDTLTALAGAVEDTTVTVKQAGFRMSPYSARYALIVKWAATGKGVRANYDSVVVYRILKSYAVAANLPDTTGEPAGSVLKYNGNGEQVWGVDEGGVGGSGTMDSLRAGFGITVTRNDDSVSTVAVDTSKVPTDYDVSLKQAKGDTSTYDATRAWVISQNYGAATISNDAYAGSWDGVTTQAPSKNAVYDKIETMGSAAGDISGVTAGFGLSGGATSGNATLDVDTAVIATLADVYETDTTGLAASSADASKLWIDPADGKVKIGTDGGTAGGMLGAAFADSLARQGLKFYNVVGYGADITGVADSKAAIQAAIDAADAAGGGTVYFPDGTYLLDAVTTNVNGYLRNRMLTVYDNIRLLGNGYNSVLKMADGTLSTTTDAHNANFVQGDSVFNVTVENLRFDGNAINNLTANGYTRTGYMVEIYGGGNVVIKNNWFINAAGRNDLVLRYLAGATNRYAQVTDNVFLNGGWYTGTTTKNLYNTDFSFLYLDFDDIVVRGNTIKEEVPDTAIQSYCGGIEVHASNAIVEENIVYGCYPGMYFHNESHDVRNIKVANNILRYCKGGIIVLNYQTSAIEDLQITNNHIGMYSTSFGDDGDYRYGIRFKHGTSSWTTGAGTGGPYRKVLIDGNTITSDMATATYTHKHWGMNLTSLHDAVISNNLISNLSYGGFQMKGSPWGNVNVSFDNNSVVNCGREADGTDFDYDCGFYIHLPGISTTPADTFYSDAIRFNNNYVGNDSTNGTNNWLYAGFVTDNADSLTAVNTNLTVRNMTFKNITKEWYNYLSTTVETSNLTLNNPTYQNLGGLEDVVPVVNVRKYVTGGAGTSASPWTGWATAITWTANTRYEFCAGWFGFTDSLNLSLQGIKLIGAGQHATYLVHTGTGKAIYLDNGEGVITGVELSDFLLKGNANTTFGVHATGLTDSKISLYVANVDTGIWLGSCITVAMPNVNMGQYAGATQRVGDGIVLTTGNGLGPTTTTLITNPNLETLTGNGISFRLGAAHNVVQGGTVENIAGWGLWFDSTTSNIAFGNSIYNMDLEHDTLGSAYVGGNYNQFHGVDFLHNKLVVANDDNAFYGGHTDSVEITATARATRFINFAYEYGNAGGIVDNGIGTLKFPLYNEDTGAFTWTLNSAFGSGMVKSTDGALSAVTAPVYTESFTVLDTVKVGGEVVWAWKVPANITITSVAAYTDANTVTFNIWERAAATPNTAGTDSVMTSPLVADTDQQVTTTFVGAGVAADSWLTAVVQAAGDVARFCVTIRYTLD